MGDFSHLDAKGEAAMVDVTGKLNSKRRARVRGRVTVSQVCAESLNEGSALEIARTARIAGIQAAKQTATLIPLCHPIPLSKVDITIEFLRDERQFAVDVVTATESVTGVEMEALCAASIAGATIYDMIKAVDPAAEVGPFHLVEKSGGKLGNWTPNLKA